MYIVPEKRLIKYDANPDVLNISKAVTVESGNLTLTTGSLVQTVPNAVIADPGNGGTITPASGAVKNICTITTAGAETRVLGTPQFIGQELAIEFGTDGGNFTIDNTAGFNDDGTASNLATFDDAGDCLMLIAVDTTDGDDWRLVAKKGVAIA